MKKTMKQQEDKAGGILVVDDNSENLRIITKYLKDAGYQCSIASNGSTALLRAELVQPVVILLDVKMPGTDGFEVCRQLKQNPLTSNIPVIFLTVLDDVKSKVRGFQEGGADYITKPINKEELLARVATHQENYLYKCRLEHEVKQRTVALEEINERLYAEIIEHKKTIEEKKILLRELYHRTKNSLQNIRSVLLLQARNMANIKEVQELAKNTENRIMAMALVHQKLYQSHDLSQISAREYLEELANLITKSYHNNLPRILLKTEIEDIFFQFDMAVPCGLVVNELLTNSLKHAFNDSEQQSCEITIKLYKEGADKLVLVFADNCNSVSPDFDFRKQKTLGMQLIIGIAETQMQGKITFDAKAGFHYCFEFPFPYGS